MQSPVLIYCNHDGFVKIPSASLRFTVKGLNVRKVRLALSRLARLAYEAFYKAVCYVIRESRFAAVSLIWKNWTFYGNNNHDESLSLFSHF